MTIFLAFACERKMLIINMVDSTPTVTEFPSSNLEMQTNADGGRHLTRKTSRKKQNLSLRKESSTRH